MGFFSEIVDDLLEGRDVKEEMVKRSQEATTIYNNLFSQITLSPIALEVRNEVMDRALFGCQRGNVLRILSVVLKEDLKEVEVRVSIPPSSLIKLRREYGPSYEVHKPYLFMGGNPTRATGPGGGVGGEVPQRLDYLEEIVEEDFKSFFQFFQKKRFVKGVVNGLEGN